MKYYLLCLAIFIGGCGYGGSKDEALASAIETPASFGLDEPWTLVMFDKGDRFASRMTIVFSSEPANACGEGWKKIEVLNKIPTDAFTFDKTPAYFVEGAKITIDLAAPVCDVHYDLQGEISDLGIIGTHGPVSPWGGEIEGKFYAVPVGT